MDAPVTPARRKLLLAACATPFAAPAWALAATSASTATAPSSAAAARLAALADRYFAALLDADPFWASRLGSATPAQAASLPIEISPAHRAKRAALYSKTLADLRRIDRKALGETDLIAYDVLAYHAQDQLAQLRHPDHLLPLDQTPGKPPFELANAADSGLSMFATVAHYEQHLSRLRALPAWCDQAVANLREGLKRGIVHPRPIIERLLPMLRNLAPAEVDKSPYHAPIATMPARFAAADRDRLAAEYRRVIEQRLHPALVRLADAVEREVLPRSRTSAGWSALPGGNAWYEQFVRTHTSTTMGAEEIHQLGLREVQRLRGKMAEVQAQYGFEGSLADFLTWHAKRPENYPYKTEQQVLDAYAELNRRIATKLPQLFSRVPKAPLEIRPEPELTRYTASDHYTQPSLDGSRPGVFFAVITDPAAYATPRMASLYLHEGQPGHHFQIALAQELPVTKLQRFYFYNAFGEGWGLYAETLGYDLGLYDDPNAHLGHLGMAMMRAVRLVVDTGMHAKGWSREQAIAYFQEQTGFNERDSRVQIERYMVWPGQALGYAIGRIKIEALRDRARAALGSRFALADFHEQVLASGSMPLAVLEAKIDRWISARQRG